MNETHTNPQAIKIHLLYAYYGKQKSSRSLESFKKQAADCAGIPVNVLPLHRPYLPRGSGSVGLAQE